MEWIAKDGIAKRLGDLQTSASGIGKTTRIFETLVSKIASGLRQIFTGNFQRQTIFKDQTVQKRAKHVRKPRVKSLG